MNYLNKATYQTYKKIWLLTLVAFIASACVTVPYYDNNTYKSLTSLKAESMTLVESFSKTPANKNLAKIDRLLLNYRKAYEYEKGKGKANKDTLKQFSKIKELLEDIIKVYRSPDGNKMGEKFYHEASVQLGQAHDIAIQTEASKNKGKAKGE